MNRKVIALFTPSLEIGGTERVVAILANHFAKEPNVEIHLILSSKMGINLCVFYFIYQVCYFGSKKW